MQRWITAAIAAAALAATGLAQAGDHRGHDWRGGRDRGGPDYRRDVDNHRGFNFRGGRDYRGGQDYRGDHHNRGGYSLGRSYGSWYPEARHAPFYGYSSYVGPGWRAPHYHVWNRGSYLPPEYFAPRYFVPDYRYYGLAPPPIGFAWVRVNGDFLLAALATGLVADALFGGY